MESSNKEKVFSQPKRVPFKDGAVIKKGGGELASGDGMGAKKKKRGQEGGTKEREDRELT